MGPIQAQTARAPFLGLAARSPTADHASITAAYESLELVRGSTIRGTVHTSTAGVHPILDVLTRLGIGQRWPAVLGVPELAAGELWESLDAYASETWRTPDELREHQTAWLAERVPDAPAAQGAPDGPGRYVPFSHGSLIRRPLKGGWEGQGAPGYRTAAALLGDRSEWYAHPGRALREAVRLHLRSHGPASREDIAWWSGVGRIEIDRAVESLGDELVTRTGPDGRAYHDLADLASLPATPPDLSGVRLLPEFDALLCAYEPAARVRFVDPDHHRILYAGANGLCKPPLLVEGRITGWWRLDGSGRTRALQAFWFAGTRRPKIAEVRRAAESVTRALPVRLTDVTLTRHVGAG